MTDKELDALVTYLREKGFISQREADAITALRAQLAEAQAEVFDFPDRKAMSRRIREQRRLIRKLQVENDTRWRLLMDANARAYRADVALAAQIEVDAGLIAALYRMALKESDADLSSPWKSHKASAYGTALQAIRNQPHDRSALARYREKVLREAADRTLGLATGHECRQSIRAMIDKEAPE